MEFLIVWCPFITISQYLEIIISTNILVSYWGRHANLPSGYFPHGEIKMPQTLGTKLCEGLRLSVIFFLFFTYDSRLMGYGFIPKSQSQKGQIIYFNCSRLYGTLLLYTNVKLHVSQLNIHLK